MLKDSLITILGEYVPNVGSDGKFLTDIASLDVAWIASAVFLIVFVYCLFRLLGGVFRG